MLDAKNFGLAGGIMCGLLLLLFTLIALYTGGPGAQSLESMMKIFPGYTVSFLGSILGFIYGFIKGFVFFYGVAWIYNRLGLS